MKKNHFITVLAFISCSALWAQQWETNGNDINNTNTGGVGIGTTDPGTDLEIYKFDGTSHLRVHTNQHSGTAILELGGGTAFLDADPNNYSGWSIYHSYNQTGRDLYFRHGETGDPSIKFTDDGNLIIGPANIPNGKLHVEGGDAWLRNMPPNDQDHALTGLHIVTRKTGGEEKRWSLWTAAIGGGYGVQPNSFEIWEYPETAPRFQIQPGGNTILAPGGGEVGIGTAITDAKLTVKGDIHAQEVKVDLNGAVAPDFVFEPDYALRTLAETEAYIKENKHLPEIPSATVMERDGIKLKEINLKLLQKIEELTLYVIDLQKQVNELKQTQNK